VKPRRVVLLGFMAAGKSEVGRALAERLGWRFVDLDREIEREAGIPIPEIFRTVGEAGFREMEVRITPTVLESTEVVVAPGGGWITNAGLLRSLPPATLSVWLEVSPPEVLRRLARESGQTARPLLDAADPAQRIRELLEIREPLYREADLSIRTDGLPVRSVVDRLEQILQGATPVVTDSNVENGE